MIFEKKMSWESWDRKESFFFTIVRWDEKVEVWDGRFFLVGGEGGGYISRILSCFYDIRFFLMRRKFKMFVVNAIQYEKGFTVDMMDIYVYDELVGTALGMFWLCGITELLFIIIIIFRIFQRFEHRKHKQTHPPFLQNIHLPSNHPSRLETPPLSTQLAVLIHILHAIAHVGVIGSLVNVVAFAVVAELPC